MLAPRRAGGVDVTATDARSGSDSARAAAKASGGLRQQRRSLTGCAPAASPRRAMLPHAALAYGRHALPLSPAESSRKGSSVGESGGLANSHGPIAATR